MKKKLPNFSPFLILLALLAVFLGFLRFSQYSGQRAIEKEKADMQKQVADFQKKNKDLSDSLSYLGSGDFQEQVARQQLGLKKNGEVVFGFTDAPTSTPNSDLGSTASLPNYEKWLNYFFGNN